MSVNFLDSNILVYLFEEKDQRKYSIAEDMVSHALQNGASIISFQVVQETLNVITQKLPVVATESQAEIFMRKTLVPLWKVSPNAELYRAALTVKLLHKYSFYDSLIIAAALQADCKILYSEDLQHGQKIDRLTIKNPFVE